MIDYRAIGGRIRRNRKAKKLTQVDLGEAVGLSAAFIGHVERGTRKASLETMIHLAEALEASLDILLTGSLRIQEEALSLAHRKQTVDDIAQVLTAHADDWMPTLRRLHDE